MSQSKDPLSAFPLGVDVSAEFDGIFYGNIISAVLFGITIVQAWLYVNNNRDKWWMRCFVAFLMYAIRIVTSRTTVDLNGSCSMLDLTSTFLGAQILHHYFVANFGNLLNMTLVSKPVVITDVVTVVVVFCVQSFFVSRVWLLGNFHWTIPAFSAAMAVAAMVSGLAGVAQMFTEISVTEFEMADLKLKVGLEAGFAAVADILATAALSWSFYQSRTGIQRTDTLLQKLLQYTVTRGLFVTVAQTTFLIMWLVQTDRLWWTPFYFNLTKIYVITMVAMLNSRESLRATAGTVVTSSDMRFAARSGLSQSQTQQSGNAFTLDKPGSIVESDSVNSQNKAVFIGHKD
ncbi:hypothetical protein GYMLUDRAFT_262265 [Collybiopsis luxurians FD-317 M1]|uniref:DUF6534 domain-containing protein n=1 Tax=Collybiopsis luxurians FD-317 M1 TaxID=944289 RepID=A0A0D0C8Y4_9AGAR|nr:hypothetical protein GYMLUDRAFT_262265 [Collybiopsis luxurians FD-317 M1]